MRFAGKGCYVTLKKRKKWGEGGHLGKRGSLRPKIKGRQAEIELEKKADNIKGREKDVPKKKKKRWLRSTKPNGHRKSGVSSSKRGEGAVRKVVRRANREKNVH